MDKVRRANPNEAITHEVISDSPLQILLDAADDSLDGYIPEHGRAQLGSWNTPVRTLPTSALQSFIDPRERKTFEAKFGIVKEGDRSRILYLIGLVGAMRTNNRRALEATIRAQKAGDYFTARALRRPLEDFGEMLNVAIRDAIFVVWWSNTDQRFLPGLYCRRIDTALGALAFLRIARPGALSVCQRARCKKPFIQSRGEQRFCSAQCQAAEGMARYRARKMRGKRTTS